MNTCVLCTFKENCQQPSILLYPLTPIVSDILERLLSKAHISYEQAGGMFKLDDGSQESLVSSALRSGLSEIEMRDIRITRSRGAEIMNASDISTWLNQSDTSWFDKALAEDRYTSYFQPIVDRKQGSIHGHECLIRLHMDRLYNGGEIMNAAVSRGRMHAFDSYVRQMTVRLAGAQHVPGTKVFINFMPSSIYDPEFCMKSTLQAMSLTALKPEDIVFEVVESEAITDVKHLKKICAFYRERGFLFALDDVGTGANSLQMVCDLRPDYMKIDKSLISRVDDSMFRAAIQKIVDLGQEFGVRVIGEGIEDLRAADACSSLGIDLMQGYYFARPAPSMVTTASSLICLKAEVHAPITAQPVPVFN